MQGDHVRTPRDGARVCCCVSVQYLTLVLAFNTSMWQSTTKWPCGPSQYVDEPAVCDYQLLGHQVSARSARTYQPARAGLVSQPAC